MTRAPLSTATDSRTRELTSDEPEPPKPKPRSKKQKVDPNEPSAEEKQAAYAAQHAKAEYDARIEAAREALEKAEDEQKDLVSELINGSVPEDLAERMDEAEAKINRLKAELEALREIPAPAEVEPERDPRAATERQYLIGKLKNKKRAGGLTPDEEAELQQLDKAEHQGKADAAAIRQERLNKERAERKLALRQEAIDNPNQAEKLFAKNEGEMKWWKTMGRHLSSQKAKHIRDGRVEELAVAMGAGRPPTPPPVRRGIVWPVDAATTDDALLKQLNAQLESLGLMAVDEQRRAHAAEEARLAPVRAQLDLDDEAAKRAAKEAKVKKANSARDKKAQAAAEAVQEASASREGAIAQDKKDAQARRAALAKQDAEAQAALSAPKWRT